MCTIIMLHKVRAVLTGQSTGSGFDLDWFSSLSSKHICVFGLHGAIYTVSQKNWTLFHLSITFANDVRF